MRCRLSEEVFVIYTGLSNYNHIPGFNCTSVAEPASVEAPQSVQNTL